MHKVLITATAKSGVGYFHAFLESDRKISCCALRVRVNDDLALIMLLALKKAQPAPRKQQWRIPIPRDTLTCLDHGPHPGPDGSGVWLETPTPGYLQPELLCESPLLIQEERRRPGLDNVAHSGLGHTRGQPNTPPGSSFVALLLEIRSLLLITSPKSFTDNL